MNRQLERAIADPASPPGGASLTAQAADLPYATPYLALHLGTAIDAYAQLRRVLPGTGIFYAQKCNPNPALLGALADQGSGFEIASRGELAVVQALGIAADRVLYSNPVKAPGDIAAAYTAGVDRFAIDSPQEVGKIAEHAPGSRVYVRLRTASASSAVPSEGKFGIGPAEAVALMLGAARCGLLPYGIAFHVGSQQCDSSAWAAALARAAYVMEQLTTRGIRLQMLDLGGGFPVQMAGTESVPSITEIGAVITNELADLPYAVETVIEPGRVIAAPAGTMVASVLGEAYRDGVRWVHLDVGACTLIEALETCQQLAFPVTDSLAAPRREPAHLTGPTCDSADTLLYDVPMSPGLKPGDRVYISQAGAYTESNGSFNGIAPPTTYVLDPPSYAIKRTIR